jgi:hypothetical protein
MLERYVSSAEDSGLLFTAHVPFPEETIGNRVSELSNLYPGNAQPSLCESVPKAVVPFSQQKYP